MGLLTKSAAVVVVEDDDDLPRNKKGQGLIIPFDKDGRPDLEAKPKPYTRVTTYVDGIEDKKNLDLWGKRTVLVGAGRLTDRALQDLLRETRELDPSLQAGKARLNELADRLLDEGGGYTKQRRGTYYHKLSEDTDRGTEPARLTRDERTDMALYKLSTMDLEIKKIEHPIVHDELRVCGRPDRISFYPGIDPDGYPAGHLITDLKTGRVDYGAIKMSAQLAFYSRSKLYDKVTGERTDMPADLNQRWGMIMHLVPGEELCEVFWIDLSIGWRAVEMCTEQRELRRLGRRVLRPFFSPQLANMSNVNDDESEDEDS